MEKYFESSESSNSSRGVNEPIGQRFNSNAPPGTRGFDKSSQLWNPEDFSRSSNILLENLQNNVQNDLSTVLMAYFNYSTDKDLAKNSSHLEPLFRLQHFLSLGSVAMQSYTASEIAEMVLKQVFTIPFNAQESKVPIRLFIAGFLLAQFEEVFKATKENNEVRHLFQDSLRALAAELLLDKPSVNLPEQLTETGNNNWETILSDETPEVGNLIDIPATEDMLSRKALAKYLSKRLNYVYINQVKTGGAFFMQIDGEWGSGKSTLLKYIQEYLNKPETIEDPKEQYKSWVITEFDAWANQRLDPPWWFIMKSVYKAIKSGFVKNRQYGMAFVLGLREHFWRLNTGSNYFLMAIATATVFFIAIKQDITNTKLFEENAFVKLLSLASFIWASFKFMQTSLVPGSAKAARNFLEQSASDPMTILAAHFKKQVVYCGHPIAIFIDNLDRCNREYGIKLLEGLQTIFRDAPVVYVVAADHKWLGRMYESQYENYADAISKPGKSFGLIFLDKIFQLIVELPSISSVQKLSYWNYLLGGAKNREELEEKRKAAREKLDKLGNNNAKMKLIKEESGNDIDNQILREEGIGSMSIGEEQRQIENKLVNFCDIVEPNPRAMKRIINDISTYRAISTLYKQGVKDEQLVMFTILKLQYPKLASWFWENPEKMDEVFAGKSSGDPLTDQLLADPDNFKMIAYTTRHGATYRLDSEFIRRMKFEVVG
jgi:hypothetical protein